MKATFNLLYESKTDQIQNVFMFFLSLHDCMKNNI